MGPVSTTWPAYMTATRLARLGDDREVVGDEDDADLELLAERHQQLQDLVLDRHVERSRRLVAEDQLRLERERDRDHHPLLHPAGELVRIGVVAPRGIRDAYLPHQLERALARAPSAVVEPHERALGDLVARCA